MTTGNIYLLEEDYDEFLMRYPKIDSGSESVILDMDEYVAKILIPDFRNYHSERRLDKMMKLDLDEYLTIPKGKIYYDYRYIGYYMKKFGKSIKDYLLENETSLDERIKILQDIKSVLEHVHEQGIVHGDLQGKNILIDDNKKIKLADINNMGFGKFKSMYFNALTVELYNTYGNCPDVDIIAFNFMCYALLNFEDNALKDYLNFGADAIKFFKYKPGNNSIFDQQVCDEQMDIATNISRKNKSLKNTKYLIDYLK